MDGSCAEEWSNKQAKGGLKIHGKGQRGESSDEGRGERSEL